MTGSTLSLLRFGNASFSWASGDAHENEACDTRSLINLKKFPEHPSDFNSKVRPYVTRIIERHGREEWKAIVLTNELHHHMGLHSIVGAKMGIREMYHERDVLKYVNIII